MSWKVIQAVQASRLEPGLRSLALTLAIHADDAGGNIWPGVRRLQQAIGKQERAVRYALRALIERQVLVPGGLHGHRRSYRFDLAQLAAYTPTTRAWRQPVENPVDTANENPAPACRVTLHRDAPLPCTGVQGTYVQEDQDLPVQNRTEAVEAVDNSIDREHILELVLQPRPLKAAFERSSFQSFSDVFKRR